MAAVTTLLYIAEPADAEAVGCDEATDDRWPSLWLRHIGDQELVQLWSVVAGLPPEPGRTLMRDLLFQGGEEGPFVMRVPEGFVAALAALPESRVPEAVAAWSRSEYLTSWWDQDGLAKQVGELREFAQRAVASGLSVLQVAHL